MAMQFVISIIHAIYILVTILVNFYSLNIFVLTILFWRDRLRSNKHIPPVQIIEQEIDWPLVAVQLPLYNENDIAIRIIDQVAKLDYPSDRLHIQVLDDSTDGTQDLVAKQVDYYRAQNIWITHHRRTDRSEYKAGALREGMKQTPADLFAVFDADFMPAADWLKKAVRPFLLPGNERLGFVQTRWSHLNDRYSILTSAQATLLDAHFGIEQTACAASHFFNYMNGTGFVLRRACAEDAGNWNGESLVEDLDLCYRAQIAGWKSTFLRDVSAPAEIPGLFSGFKRQQYRWAKGSVQTIRRLTWKLIKAPLPLTTRIEALFHLFGYLIQPLMLLLLIVALPLYTWSNDWLVKLPIHSLGIIGVAIPLYYISAEITLYPPRRWLDLLIRLPALSLVGVGIAVNNTLGIIDGFRKGPIVFERTLKMGSLQHHRMDYRQFKIPIKISKSIGLEILLAIYASFATMVALQGENYVAAYFFAVYVLGFSWVAAAELFENLAAGRNRQ